MSSESEGHKLPILRLYKTQKDKSFDLPYHKFIAFVLSKVVYDPI